MMIGKEVTPCRRAVIITLHHSLPNPISYDKNKTTYQYPMLYGPMVNDIWLHAVKNAQKV
ncbi:hypothetical protein L873DRAFT_1276450 [Choiromyces venosus 120613-1]|uniref:Uncharacterized protein n=1 Tax=Choiromyces venosus 120613-1 TaxID=1336337 RepID=A0A3N4K204_9PEZI|nr:hypothetical protein L873DRAFT_1276450 [Choiromyces venosus 120613-1]